MPGIDRRCAGRKSQSSWTQSYFNGTSSVATIWSAELARLTGHRRLDDLTLLSLSRVASTNGLVAEKRKWCPLCLREQERDGSPYGQLLWEIETIEACPVHATELVSRCRCGGTGVYAPTAKRLPHVCQYCCRSLAEPHQPRKAPPVALRRARLVSELLDNQDFDRGSWPANGISRFLIGAAHIYFEGESARLSKALGLCKATVHGWANDGRRPTLHRIVGLADVFGCPIRSVLQGDVSCTRIRRALSVGPLRKKASPIRPELRKRIPSKLHAILQRRQPISLTQAARELGIDRWFLQRNYRSACDAMVARFKRHRAAEVSERRSRLIELFRRRAVATAAGGRKPTIVRVMGKASAKLIRMRRECNEILAEIRAQTECTQARR